MIGAATGIPYDASMVKLAPKSRLYLYSDGIFEITRPDGRMTSLDLYVEQIARLHGTPAALDGMIAWGQGEQGSPQFVDDVSLLEVFFNP
jgi:sigma-B regulation protein RsbU (phosphoserine phosphatase)